MRRLLKTNAPAATVVIRLMVGGVFFVEGILKFLQPSELGAEVMGTFVGEVEIVCGALVIIGLLTRFAAIPLLIDISVALVSTKMPILLGQRFWGFSLTKLPRYGLLSMLHEARTDLCMWLGLVFLLMVGAGRKWSLDARLPAPTQDSTLAR